MAFDDLLPNQINPLIQLLEALNSGNFRDEFVVVRRSPPRSNIIRLHSNSGDSVHEMEGFYDTGLHALNEAGYITITAEGRASLKPKAFQEYDLHNNRKQSPKAMNHDTYLRLLVTLYSALGGNLRKSVNLVDVLKNEGLSQSELEGVMEYMISEGWVESVSDESLDVYFKHPGIKAAQSYRPSNPNATSDNQNVTAPKDARKVFVVHGRNLEARTSLFRFLRSINLTPLEWSQAIRMTGKASPFIGEILDVAFSTAQAVVVLMTPDDVAELREPFRSSDDPPYESQLTGQARPNVLFEAGMAMGRNPDRTVIVELGKLRPFSDIAGRHTVRLSNNSAARQELAQRLETAGCPVDLTGRDWHTDGDFSLKDVGSTVKSRGTPKATKKSVKGNVGSALVGSIKKGKGLDLAPQNRSSRNSALELPPKTKATAEQIETKPASELAGMTQVATQWLREFLTPVVNLTGEIKEKFNQGAFTIERETTGPGSTAYTYRINFFQREKWGKLLTSDVGEFFLFRHPQIGEVLASFGKIIDNFESAFSELEKTTADSPFFLNHLKNIYARLIERERIPRSQFEHFNLQEITKHLLGQAGFEISNHPVEAKDNLVRFTAYTLLELNITFKPNTLNEDQRLYYFCRDISSELSGKDEAVSKSLEEAQKLFETTKGESSALHQKLKRDRMGLAAQYNVPF